MRVAACALLSLSPLAVSSGCRSAAPEARRDLPVGSFEVLKEVVVPLSPEDAYDAFTNDLGRWWDHTFSPQPKAFYLEARPGGGFYEIFDDSGDGVLHARVTWAQRGERLVFRGPLGLHGRALDMVHTITFEPWGPGQEGTLVRASIHGMGELQDGAAEAVGRAWQHFLIERYAAWTRGELAPG